MNINQFWQSEKRIAIHCNDKTKAKKLLRIFTIQGHTWKKENLPYTQSAWSIWKEQTCYDNKGEFGQTVMYRAANIEVVDFDELDEFKPLENKHGEIMPSSLTPRQWRTYNFIKEHSLKGEWVNKETIIKQDAFDKDENPNGYIYRDRKHDICAGIWEDIDTINMCPELDKIVISDGKNRFKLAENKAEAMVYLDNFKVKAIKSLVRYSRLKSKVLNDGQGKLLSNRLNPIDEESKAREYIETYLKTK